MTDYCVYNSQKHKASAVGNLEAEARRLWDDPSDYKGDVCLERSRDNVVLVDTPLRDDGTRATVLEAAADIYAAHGKSIDAASVPVITTVYRASPAFFKEHPDKVMPYFNACLEWERKHHGKVLYAVIHFDENSPHMHVFTCPEVERQKVSRVYARDENGERIRTGTDKNGRPRYKRVRVPVTDDAGNPVIECVISASDVLGGPVQLSRAQTSFANEVGKRFGLERGEERVSDKADKVIVDTLRATIAHETARADAAKREADDAKREADDASRKARRVKQTADIEVRTQEKRKADAARDADAEEERLEKVRADLEKANTDLGTARDSVKSSRIIARGLSADGDGLNWKMPGPGRVKVEHAGRTVYHERSVKEARDDAAKADAELADVRQRLEAAREQLRRIQDDVERDMAAERERRMDDLDRELEQRRADELAELTREKRERARAFDSLTGKMQPYTVMARVLLRVVVALLRPLFPAAADYVNERFDDIEDKAFERMASESSPEAFRAPIPGAPGADAHDDDYDASYGL